MCLLSKPRQTDTHGEDKTMKANSTSKQKKGLRGSIDDVLGDLLGDDADDINLKARSPSGGLRRPAGVLRTQSGKRNLLDDDFFSKLAEEAEKDAEDSDVSEADPKALLESMKDMDDMDADLFGSKKKPSSAPAQSRTSRTGMSKPGDKNKTNPEIEDRKPSSAPPASSAVRSYRKFSFMDDGNEDDGDDDEISAAKQEDLNDPMDELLNDPDEEQPKSIPSGKAGKQQSSSPAVQKKEAQAASVPTPKKRNELNFDDDGDDLMDALGFSDAPKGGGRGLVPKKESDAPQRSRTRLDEILGIGTSPRLLERPVTGEKKDTTPAEGQPQKSSAGKDSAFGDEDLTFGSYQPTLGSTPEGRTSRRHSVRFSTEDVSSPSPERKPTTSTITSTRPGRASSDWLGLKQDEAEQKEEPKQQKKESTEASDRLKTLSSPSLVGGNASRVTLKPTEEFRARPDSPGTSTTIAPKSELKKREGEEQDDWLAGALSKKKALVEERGKRQEESLGLGEEIDLDTFLGNHNTTLTSHRTKEDTPLPPRQPSRESVVVSSRQQSPVPASGPSTGVQRTQDPEQKPTVVSAAPVQQVSTDGLQQLLLPQQLTQGQLWAVGAPLDLKRRDAEHHTTGTTALQNQIIQLEGQVRSLQLEKDQVQMLLDNVQQRHKHDTELMENTHRARVKLLEESAVQRETRAHMENQELMERLEAVMKLAQQERAELQEQHQRRLAQSQQERDREVERLRDLQ
ncbi:fas-binding factor 1 isoform X1, partial [Clarias magur]